MNKITLLIFITLFPVLVFGQEATPGSQMGLFQVIAAIIGKKGILFAIALVAFLMSFKNSVKLFDWLEDQTFGTRDYILEKCDLLFFEIEPIKVTYILLFLTFGTSTIVFCTFTILHSVTVGAVLALIAGVIGWKIPRPIINILVEKRVKKYETQMVDGLNLLANGLRAGLSLPQSVGLVVGELPAPISQEFNYVLQQNKIGVPLDEAFQKLADRMPTEDNDMFITAISILRETGGNLAEVFDTITEIIRERIRLKQKIDTFVAQGKAQGGLISSMPLVLGLYFSSTDPNFTEALFGDFVGLLIFSVVVLLNVLGAFAMFKIIQIKV
jgi:tight adherence protein B